jgi:anti-repressor protein
VQDVDFVDHIIMVKGINGLEVVKAIEYYISLDMAKELSMVENNEEGRKARKFFIAAEKQLRKPSTPQNYIQALQALIVAEMAKEVALLEVDRLETKIAEDAPNTLLGSILSEGRGTIGLRIWVKTLKHENNFVIGEGIIFQWLIDNKYLYRDVKGLVPMAKYEPGNRNYFTVKLEEHNGALRRIVKITNKGAAAITPRLLAAFPY